ncbi:MBL fold metallo-hydrolase [Angustibacter sp. Root456]|uniref:MBL fold metallo-hydrolase n=1 Tax=Angustibacter sp. Root456 TaxID=1736539 RepID=UPI0006FAE60A|nr:MBL fold metallo-hydrolase [Angustibacter sp. Root456]KQX69359.1 MBL fold metallo-hydrolase [Angustibacter sp. Root456]
MATAPAIELAPNVWRLPLLASFVNGYVLRDDDGQVTLVDCGVKKSPAKISAALTHLGIAPEQVTRILLTHAHADHAGGAAEMVRRTGAEAVAIHADDAAAARSGIAPPRDQSLRLGRLLTRGSRSGKPAFEPVPVDEELADGQVLPVAGGLRVVHTPGHSPGHVSLLHEPTGVLVVGDALFNWRGIGWSVPFFCSDFRLSQRTAQRFTELDFTVAAFMHGPHVSTNARRYVGEFLARYTHD